MHGGEQAQNRDERAGRTVSAKRPVPASEAALQEVVSAFEKRQKTGVQLDRIESFYSVARIIVLIITVMIIIITMIVILTVQ
jgi:hypothetical protein